MLLSLNVAFAIILHLRHKKNTSTTHIIPNQVALHHYTFPAPTHDLCIQLLCTELKTSTGVAKHVPQLTSLGHNCNQKENYTQHPQS